MQMAHLGTCWELQLSLHGLWKESMTDLGDRMKSYECAARTTLVPRMPILIRIDGKAFHTFTQGLKRPFCEDLNSTMDLTTHRLLEDIQGAILGYTQSDEISLLLQCDAKNESEAWFGGGIQKITSVAASMATAYFNSSWREWNGKTALFDARVWNMPWEDVPNYFIWRHKDWYRNSVSMAARAHFSHQDCHKQSVSDLMDMLHSIGKPWQDLTDRERNGRFFVPGRVTDATKSWLEEFNSCPFDYTKMNGLIAELRLNELDDELHRLDKPAVV